MPSCGGCPNNSLFRSRVEPLLSPDSLGFHARLGPLPSFKNLITFFKIVSVSDPARVTKNPQTDAKYPSETGNPPSESGNLGTTQISQVTGVVAPLFAPFWPSKSSFVALGP